MRAQETGIQRCGWKCPRWLWETLPRTASRTPGRAQPGDIAGSQGRRGAPVGLGPGRAAELRDEPGAVAPRVSSVRWGGVVTLLRKPAGLRGLRLPMMLPLHLVPRPPLPP